MLTTAETNCFASWKHFTSYICCFAVNLLLKDKIRNFFWNFCSIIVLVFETEGLWFYRVGCSSFSHGLSHSQEYCSRAQDAKVGHTRIQARRWVFESSIKVSIVKLNTVFKKWKLYFLASKIIFLYTRKHIYELIHTYMNCQFQMTYLCFQDILFLVC